MNGFMKITACCMVLSAGCQAPDRLGNWSRQDALQNSAATEHLTAEIEKNSPGLASRAAQGQSSRSLEEHIRLGQAEVTEWYRDKSSLRLKTARTHFETALTMAPQSSSAHHGLAIVADLEKNYAEAERHYQQALIQKPNDSDILGDMGYSYLLQNRFSESEQYSLRAVQANPANLNAVKHLGDAYARQGKSDKARETYAKVYDPEEVQKALAQNAPSAEREPAAKSGSSIFDRLVPGMSPGQKLVSDIQRRQQEYEEQVKRQAPPRSTNISPSSQERLAEESVLKQRLQEIDRQEMARYQGGPILVDDQTGQLTRLPGAENSHSMNSYGTPTANFGPLNLQAPTPGAHQSQNSPYFADSSPISGLSGDPAQRMQQPGDDPDASGGNRLNQQFGMSPPLQQQAGSGQTVIARNQSMHDQSMHDQSIRDQSMQGGSMQPLMGSAPNDPRYQLTPADPRQPQNPQANMGRVQPWNGIQQVSASSENTGRGGVRQADQQGAEFSAAFLPTTGNGFVNNPDGRSLQHSPMQNVNGNLNQQFIGNTNSMVPAGAYAPQNLQGQPGNPQSAGVSGQSPADAYRAASKAAARMGMGVGSGSIFPVMNDAQTIHPPGSMNYDNTNTPPPQRWMPDAVPPQNLNDAYQPYPNPVRPPATSQGQAPPVTYPSYSKEQFGTASRYDTRTMQNSGIPRDYNSSMQDYETQRWIAGREANMAVNQIWNQGPVNSPVSPSAGSLYTHPNSQGMMYTPNAPAPDGQGQIPEQWPYPPVARQAEPSPPQYGNQQYGNQQYGNQSSAQAAEMNRQFNQQDNSPMQNGSVQNPQFNNVSGNRFNSNQGVAPSSSVPFTSGTQSVHQTSGHTVYQNPENIVIPSDYRSVASPDSVSRPSPVTPASAADTSMWPTIIPAGR